MSPTSPEALKLAALETVSGWSILSRFNHVRRVHAILLSTGGRASAYVSVATNEPLHQRIHFSAHQGADKLQHDEKIGVTALHRSPKAEARGLVPAWLLYRKP